MLPLFTIITMIILGLSNLVGILINVFIVAVNCLDKAKCRATNSCVLILSTLGAFNICFQFTMTANEFCVFQCSKVYFSDQAYPIFLFFTIFSSFWFTVCLCGFYCLQIILFTLLILVQLKQSISSPVSWMLLWSVLISLLIILPAAWSIYKDPINNMTSDNFMANTTLDEALSKLNLYYLLFNNIIGCFLPLFLVGVSNILIVTSLCVHSRRMEQGRANFSTPRVEACLRAAKTVTSLLLLYVCFYFLEALIFLDIFTPTSTWMCVCLMVICVYSPTQSAIFILGSPKLRRISMRMFHRPKMGMGGHELPGKNLMVLSGTTPQLHPGFP
ncbi:taste receptor type 2 member 40-like [Rhinatrema bivittatum]|uniref:taste receptor type 2 member 40-like n=1 Tax=Rhinatrema bivittatum TaxID=194408 RepID=UPI00112727CB|nr:taste receptor type 2 member 40-like [Rhinatrema bivittatum]